jgi:hypothetical protein
LMLSAMNECYTRTSESLHPMISREMAFTRRRPLPSPESSSEGFQGPATQLCGSLFVLAQSALDPVLSDG